MRLIKFMVLSLLFLFFGNQLSYAAIDQTSSGISRAYYQIKWCSPSLNGGQCVYGYFDGSSTTIQGDGTGFTSAGTNPLSTSTWKRVSVSSSGTNQDGNSISESDLQNFFDQFKFIAEGVFEVKVRVFDKVTGGSIVTCSDPQLYTTNCQESVTEYLLDKTHPNISNISFIENSKYLYVGRSSVDANNSLEYDSNSGNSGTNKFKSEKGAYSSLLSSPHSVQSVTKSDIYTIYYSGIENATLNLTINLFDYFTPSNSSESITENPEFVSKLQKIELLDSNHSPVSIFGIPASEILDDVDGIGILRNKTLQINTTDTVDEELFYFRVTDNAGNFDELPFYVIKDTEIDIQESDIDDILRFKDPDIGVLLATKQPYNGEEHFVSKFFEANDLEGININITDGSNSANDSGIADIIFEVEDENLCGIKNKYVLKYADGSTKGIYDQDEQVNNSLIYQGDIDFKNVYSLNPSCSLSSKGTYRYYRSNFMSIDDDGNITYDQFCDKVGNCTDWMEPIVFRVVADEVDYNKSPNQISSKGRDNLKMIANGKAGYNFMVELRDRFENPIVPVFSDEENSPVKDVTVTYSFDEMIYSRNLADKTTNNLTGVVKFVSNENDEDEHFDGYITSNVIVLSEDDNGAIDPDGAYDISIFSYVPTSDMYPWLGNDKNIVLGSVHMEASIENDNLIKKTEDVGGVFTGYIGEFDNNKFNSGKEIIDLEKGSMGYKGENEYFDMDGGNSGQGYGNLISNYYLSSGPMIGNLDRKIEFEFAAPFVVGIDDLNVITEGVKTNFKYNIWNIDPNYDHSNLLIYEKFLTNQPLEFLLGKDVEDSNSVTDSKADIYGGALSPFRGPLDGSSIDNFTLFESLTNYSKNDFNNYVKAYVEPDFAEFINLNDFNAGLVSKITVDFEEADGIIVTLPSDGRGLHGDVIDGTTFPDKRYGDSLAYHNSDYTNSKTPISENNGSNYDADEIEPKTQSVKVTGLTSSSGRTGNKGDIVSGEGSNDQKFTSMLGNLKKFEIKANVQRNVHKLMRGRNWNGSSSSNSHSIPNFSFLEQIATQKIEMEKETIYPFIGDVTISGDLGIPSGSHTIIVKDGFLRINGNIYKQSTDSLLNIIVIKEGTFGDSNYSDSPDNDGFIYIDANITNLEAYVYAQGAVVSYSGSKLYRGDNVTDNDVDIFNQLYVYGGIISENTIGGSRLSTPECPWFQKVCGMNESQAFDLIYFRRYSSVDPDIYGSTGDKVPYIPVSVADSLSDYNNSSNRPKMGGGFYCELTATTSDCTNTNNSDLRDPGIEAKPYPLYVEFDPMIQTNRSSLFLEN